MSIFRMRFLTLVHSVHIMDLAAGYILIPPAYTQCTHLPFIHTLWYRVGAKNIVMVRAGLISMMSWLILLRNQCSSVCWLNIDSLLYIDFTLLHFWVKLDFLKLRVNFTLISNNMPHGKGLCTFGPSCPQFS